MSGLTDLLRRAAFRRAVAAMGTTAIALYSVSALVEHNIISSDYSEGPSMYPTIPSEPTKNIQSRLYHQGKNIKVGDIVVFKSPLFPEQRSCKRVIGMPNDYVVRDPSMSYTVGGAPVPGIQPGDSKDKREEPVMIQVPEGHVWVAGDNLSYSRDSRFHGPVPMALIQGKTLYVGNGRFEWTSFRGPQLQPAALTDNESNSSSESEASLKKSQPG